MRSIAAAIALRSYLRMRPGAELTDQELTDEMIAITSQGALAYCMAVVQSRPRKQRLLGPDYKPNSLQPFMNDSVNELQPWECYKMSDKVAELLQTPLGQELFLCTIQRRMQKVFQANSKYEQMGVSFPAWRRKMCCSQNILIMMSASMWVYWSVTHGPYFVIVTVVLARCMRCRAGARSRVFAHRVVPSQHGRASSC